MSKRSSESDAEYKARKKAKKAIFDLTRQYAELNNSTHTNQMVSGRVWYFVICHNTYCPPMGPQIVLLFMIISNWSSLCINIYLTVYIIQYSYS